MKKAKQTTRRRFVSQTLKTTAAGVLFPYVAPSFVSDATGQTAPSNRVRIGYIGAGRRSGGLRGIPRVAQVTGVADVNIERARRLASHTKSKAYQDYRKMLDSKTVDAVIISTPDHWHALPTIHACRRGVDVYCEKPLTLTVKEGRAMVEAARKYKCIVQTGSQQRSMKQNRIACELIRNGRIGKVHTVIAHNYESPWEFRFAGEPAPKELDWDMWCGQTDLVPYNKDIYISRANPGWISFRTYSGGEMTGWGAHGLDQVQWALGMDESGPVKVWTVGGDFDPPTYTKPEGRGRGDKACSKPIVHMKYADGTVMKLENGPPGGAVFIGDKGKITISRGRFTAEPAELGTEPLKDPETRLYVSDNHMINWIECIKSRKPPIADVETGHRSTTVCHLANIARWAGRPLTWDPEKEVFTGDADANKFLTREGRKPYRIPGKV